MGHGRHDQLPKLFTLLSMFEKRENLMIMCKTNTKYSHTHKNSRGNDTPKAPMSPIWKPPGSTPIAITFQYHRNKSNNILNNAINQLQIRRYTIDFFFVCVFLNNQFFHIVEENQPVMISNRRRLSKLMTGSLLFQSMISVSSLFNQK